MGTSFSWLFLSGRLRSGALHGRAASPVTSKANGSVGFRRGPAPNNENRVLGSSGFLRIRKRCGLGSYASSGNAQEPEGPTEREKRRKRRYAAFKQQGGYRNVSVKLA